MKAFFSLLLFTLLGKIAVAQLIPELQISPRVYTVLKDSAKSKAIRICTPSRASLIGQEPLYVIKSHGKVIINKFLNINTLNPHYIKNLNIYKDSASVAKYGLEAKYGVIEITLDDEKYPNAFRSIQIDSIKKKS